MAPCQSIPLVVAAWTGWRKDIALATADEADDICGGEDAAAPLSTDEDCCCSRGLEGGLKILVEPSPGRFVGVSPVGFGVAALRFASERAASTGALFNFSPGASTN